MTIQTLNLGTYANDGTGDDLRTAFTKVNSNFAELDTLTIVGGTNLGSGSPVFASVVPDAGTGNKLSFRSILAGTNIAISNDSNTISITTTGTITANLTGNVTGNVTGNLTGNVTGNVTGNLTGNVTGQISDITNHKLAALEDVSNFEPVDGQFLRYSSGLWSYTGINSDMVDEGTSRLYFTNYRARQSISVSGNLSYDNISGVISYTAPQLSPVATSGSYSDLTNKPNLFSGSYSDLTNKPNLFSGSYSDLTNKPNLFSGSYSDLTDKPNLADRYFWSIAADDSTQKLVNTGESIKFIGGTGITTSSDTEGNITISGFSGSYNDLTNRPIESIPGATIDLGSIIPRQISSLLELVLYSVNIDLGTFINPLPLLYDAGTI